MEKSNRTKHLINKNESVKWTSDFPLSTKKIITATAIFALIQTTTVAQSVIESFKNLNNTPYNSSFNKKGYLNAVTSFGVNNTGGGNATNNTNKLNACIAAAKDNHLAVYLPPGTYLINNTLEMFQNADYMTSCCVIVGSEQGANRPVIRLKNASPGFNNTNNRKPVIYMRGFNGSGNHEGPALYNALIKGIDIDLGNSNAGAVGINAHGAQGCAIQDVKIFSSTGSSYYAGLEGGLGGGACTGNLEIIGGKYGLYSKDYLDCPVYVGLTLKNQTTAAIYTGNSPNASPITFLGFHITSNRTGEIFIADRNNYHPNAGNLAFVDGVIERSTSGTAVRNKDASVYFRNVYFKNASIVVKNDKGANRSGNSSGWCLLKEYSFFEQANSVIINSSKKPATTTPHLNEYDASVNAPNVAELISRHVWDDTFPHFQQGGNSTTIAPNGTNDTNNIQTAIDNYQNVFLQRGDYFINNTINLRANTRLIGVSRNLTRIKTKSGWTNKNNPLKAMFRSPNDPNAETTIGFFAIFMPKDQTKMIGQLEWRSGKKSMVREVWFYKAGNGTGSQRHANMQRIWIHGANAGGRFYSLFSRSGFYDSRNINYRHCLIQGTEQPLFIYAYTPEYAFDGCKYQVEVKDSKNVVICGLKGEVRTSGGNPYPTIDAAPILGINNSQNVFVLSGGGTEYTDHAEGILEIGGGSTKVLVVNKGRRNGTHPPKDGGTWGVSWNNFYDLKNVNDNVYITCNEPFVSLYKKGSNLAFPNINGGGGSGPADALTAWVAPNPPTSVTGTDVVTVRVQYSTASTPGNRSLALQLTNNGVYQPANLAVDVVENVNNGQTSLIHTFVVNILNGYAGPAGAGKWKVRLMKDGSLAQGTNPLLITGVTVYDLPSLAYQNLFDGSYTTTFTTDFDGDTANFDYVGGALRNNGTIGKMVTHKDGATWSDYEIMTKMRTNNGPTASWKDAPAIVFREVDANNYEAISINGSNNKIIYSHNGSWAAAGNPFPQGEWVYFLIRVQGKTVNVWASTTAYPDGSGPADLTKTNNAMSSTGSIGFKNFGNTVGKWAEVYIDGI